MSKTVAVTDIDGLNPQISGDYEFEGLQTDSNPSQYTGKIDWESCCLTEYKTPIDQTRNVLIWFAFRQSEINAIWCIDLGGMAVRGIDKQAGLITKKKTSLRQVQAVTRGGQLIYIQPDVGG